MGMADTYQSGDPSEKPIGDPLPHGVTDGGMGWAGMTRGIEREYRWL